MVGIKVYSFTADNIYKETAMKKHKNDKRSRPASDSQSTGGLALATAILVLVDTVLDIVLKLLSR